jgi:hypothetical protein
VNRWLIVGIAIGVIAAHGLLFWLVGNSSALPKIEYVPPDNFHAKAADFTDPKTGDKLHIEEFTVSTRFHENATSKPATP